MAKKSKIVKNNQRIRKLQNAMAAGVKPKYAIRIRNRCEICGRPRGYIRMFGLCRQCVRQLASNGQIAGLKKSSW